MWPSAWRVNRCWPKCFCIILHAAELCRFLRCGEQRETGNKSYFNNFFASMLYSQKWCKKKMLSSFSVSPKLGVSKLHFKKRYLKLILVWYRLVTVKLIKLINWNHTLNQVRFWLGAHVCGQWSLNVSFSLWWVLNAFKAKGKCVRMWAHVRMSTYVR